MIILFWVISFALLVLLLLIFLPRIFLRPFLSVEDLYSEAFDHMNVLYDWDPEISKREWLNYGLWYDETQTYEEACDNLALKLATIGNFNSHDRILDVGCGFGTSSRFWYDLITTREIRPPVITGLNISRHHIAKANEISAKRGYPQSLNFVVGDATNLSSFRGSGITKVVALECAFHFNTREKFFWEAFEVLSPGGKIVMADIIMKKGTPTYLKLKKFIPSFLLRPFFGFFSEVGQMPLENQVELDDYIFQMEKAGFRNIRFEQVMHLASKSVGHYRKKVRAIKEGRIPPWLEPFDIAAFKKADRVMTFVNFTFRYADYILVVAEKSPMPDAL